MKLETKYLGMSKLFKYPIKCRRMSESVRMTSGGRHSTTGNVFPMTSSARHSTLKG